MAKKKTDRKTNRYMVTYSKLRNNLGGVTACAIDLKELLEYTYDNAPDSVVTRKRLKQLAVAIDRLDIMVGHLCEADVGELVIPHIKW